MKQNKKETHNVFKNYSPVKQFNIEDVNILVDAYCSDTSRSHDDFTKIMNFILHIPGLAEHALQNITTYYKKKYYVVSVGDQRGEIYFYQSLN